MEKNNLKTFEEIYQLRESNYDDSEYNSKLEQEVCQAFKSSAKRVYVRTSGGIDFIIEHRDSKYLVYFDDLHSEPYIYSDITEFFDDDELKDEFINSPNNFRIIKIE